LDRIDIHIEVPAVRYQELASAAPGEPSSVIRQRVMAARKIQQARFKGLRKVHCNASMRPKDLSKLCPLDGEVQNLLKMALSELNLSARAYDRIVKVARTIADLEGAAAILPNHVTEAIQYRTLDRQYWA
ncbi:MAG: ATP-binding protein, partial [Lentisphaerae bacterium]|nr:ATP-binding protein [Lentisphaerota bacterium]